MQLPLNAASHYTHLDSFTILSYTAAAAAKQLWKYTVPNKSEAHNFNSIEVAHLQ